MQSTVHYRPATTSDLPQLLALQTRNSPDHISATEARTQGFVTVRHDIALLAKMNHPHPHQIAVAEGRVVGYALVMERAFAQCIPVLVPFFKVLDTLQWQGKPLTDTAYFVMGQVAVAKSYRGQGIFDGLYRALADRLLPPYALIVTEIATRNTRSVRAHARVGFKAIHEYTDPAGETWSVVAWEGVER